MAKTKIPKEQAAKNKAHASKVGNRVRFTIGKARNEFVGKVVGQEGLFALVLIDGQSEATRVYPSTCYPE